MKSGNLEADFNAALCRRIRQLREERRMTQEQMATALGIPTDRYRKYEVRSPLPQYLLPRFALIVGCDLHFLLTGKPFPGTVLSRPRATRHQAA